MPSLIVIKSFFVFLVFSLRLSVSGVVSLSRSVCPACRLRCRLPWGLSRSVSPSVRRASCRLACACARVCLYGLLCRLRSALAAPLSGCPSPLRSACLGATWACLVSLRSGVPRLSAVSPLRRGSESVRVACLRAPAVSGVAVRLLCRASVIWLSVSACRGGLPCVPSLRLAPLSGVACRPAVSLRLCRCRGRLGRRALLRCPAVCPSAVSALRLPCCASCACACGAVAPSRVRVRIGVVWLSRARVRIGGFFLRLFSAWQDGCLSPRSGSLRPAWGVPSAVSVRRGVGVGAPGAWGCGCPAWVRSASARSGVRQLSRLELIGFVRLMPFFGGCLRPVENRLVP